MMIILYHNVLKALLYVLIHLYRTGGSCQEAGIMFTRLLEWRKVLRQSNGDWIISVCSVVQLWRLLAGSLMNYKEHITNLKFSPLFHCSTVPLFNRGQFVQCSSLWNGNLNFVKSGSWTELWLHKSTMMIVSTLIPHKATLHFMSLYTTLLQ